MIDADIKLHPSCARLYSVAAEIGDDAPAKVSTRLNVSAQVLQNWEGRGVSKDGALQAQAVYGCDANWLLGIQGASIRASRMPSIHAVATTETRPGYVRFQLMDAIGGAGPGMINPDYPEVLREVELAEWQVREELGRIPSPARIKLLTVRGESMSPRIRSGDVVFVDIEDQRPYDGGIFVIVLHGHALVKRLEVRTDGLHIVSLAEPNRPDILPPNKMESLHIAGRVLGAFQLRRAEDL
nr:helix-turn-helix transcriptional regulator [Rhodanobacter glycinis]